MVDETRRCTRCLKWLPMDDFYRRMAYESNSHHSECKTCFRARALAYKREHRQVSRRAERTGRANLSDRYIKSQLIARGIPADQITEQVVQAKRLQLQIRRIARQLKKAAHETVENDPGITG